MAYAKLTRRELEVVARLVDGLSNREIADVLRCSKRTVDSHMRSVMRKTGTSTRTQLAVYALKTGLADCAAGDEAHAGT